jgi:radical SAM superfamily enzyme YgiQ (UPF0313 family)
MTFQRRTAERVVPLARTLEPKVKVVLEGYDPSLAPEAYEVMAVDYIVRGEGEVTFRELLRALENGCGFEAIPGLSYRKGTVWQPNRPRTGTSTARRRNPAPQSCRSPTSWLYIARPTCRRGQDFARLHLPLQLLLHYHYAGPQMLHL